MLSRFSNLALRAITNFVEGSRTQRHLEGSSPSCLVIETLEDRTMLSAVTFNSQTGALVVSGDATDDTIALVGSADSQGFTVSINNDPALTQFFSYSDVSSLRVFAGSGNDTVTSSLLINTEIRGEDGNDRLEGGSGNDKLYGGNGNDVLLGGDGNDILRGQFGDDRLYGEGGNDNLRGWDGADRLYGGNGRDTIGGDSGDDKIYGGDGNDILNGGDGIDFLNGENGDDRLKGDAGQDELRGGYGNDILLGGAGDDTLRGQFGSDKLYGENGDDNLRGWDGNDRLYGGNGLDAIGGDNGDDKIYGGAGVDILNGHSGNDRLEGDAGEDELNGGAGNDILLGGDDNDFLRGEVGADRIYGEDGDDIFRGGDGADRLYGGNGRDIIGGDDGGDRIYGEDGKDTLKGGGDNDFLYGGNGDDVINGGAGNDIVAGQADNDSLYGDSGIDKLYGGAGRDGLFGGVGGGDRLAGGENDDRFLTFAEGSTGTPVVLDTITDLSNEDVEVLIVDNLTPAVTGNLLVGQTWADDEVQLVDASLRNLHLHISNANLLRYSSDESNWLFKFNTSLNAAGVNYRYLPIIGIAADAFTAYPYYVDEIVYHEIGHNFDEQYENRFINDFRAISNWDTTQDPGDTLSRDGNWYYNDTADNFFWYYATTNPYEDYAVTFNHYFQTEYHGYNYDPATGVTPAKFANVEQFLNLLDG